jgi:hypothetical protein
VGSFLLWQASCSHSGQGNGAIAARKRMYLNAKQKGKMLIYAFMQKSNAAG